MSGLPQPQIGYDEAILKNCMGAIKGNKSIKAGKASEIAKESNNGKLILW